MATNLVEPHIIVERDLVGDYVFEFKEQVLSALETGGLELIIDMSNVRLMGSSAIGVLGSAVNTMKLSNGTVGLKGLNPDILRVLKLMGMTKTFKIYE